MRYKLRPLGVWTDPVTASRTSSGLFRADWNATVALLGDEVDRLEGQDPVIIQVDITETDLRHDGRLRANSSVGSFPGVIVSFQSKFGALRYATDAYEQRYSDALPSWQANVRAVALGLEALRAVDRYGVSKRGEQYKGWTSITAGGSAGGLFTAREEAERWLCASAAENGIATWSDWETLYKRLAKRMHPDVGGDGDLWERLNAAAAFLGVKSNA